MRDRRERPWRKLRVIVEVTVPPTNRSSEKDLMYAVREAMAHVIPLPRREHADRYDAVVRIKTFSAFLPMHLKAKNGVVHVKPRRPRNKPVLKLDEFGGL